MRRKMPQIRTRPKQKMYMTIKMTHMPKQFLGTYKGAMLFVFVFFLIVNFISSGGHTDMWDGMVMFMVTESMSLKHTAQLHPEIPTISNASTTSRINTMV